jgi:hypothetical protein
LIDEILRPKILLIELNSADRNQTATESFGGAYALRNFVIERFGIANRQYTIEHQYMDFTAPAFFNFTEI